MSKRIPSIVINDILYCIDHVTTYTAYLLIVSSFTVRSEFHLL